MALVGKYSVVLLLPLLLVVLRVVAEGSELVLKRQKREWIIPPRKLKENVDYRGLKYIAKIRSDHEYKSKVIYSLTGSGADQPPFGRFTVDADTGLVKVTAILDREEIALYHLLGVAKYTDGSRAEKDIDLRIVVEDQNDCPPVFEVQQMGSVSESSASGTVIMRMLASDADEANTAHSQIFYSIVEKSASDRMFTINHQTGEVMVRQNTLDRETQETYTLTVQGTDLNGAVGGLSGTGETVITLLDINDNIPTLEQESYEGSVKENTINIEVMRIKAVDLDLIHTDSWLAVFSIVSGNEAGYFSITTDTKTNEGIIMIHKALDYEQLKVIHLALSVSNKAEYNFGSIIRPPVTALSYPIKINVVNVREGPRFQPAVKVVTISEDKTTVSINKVITNYAAIDSDTLQIATNVRYAKLYDVDSWLIIDERTADIKLNKLPDRESIYLINGTYYAKIICITTEIPTKTATGTIAIQVEDFNDHCPTLSSSVQTMCLEDNMVYVTAVDGDSFPNSAPFMFRVIQEDSKEKWTVEYLNATTIILRDNARLWPGEHKVSFEIKDQQGKSCGDVQVLNVVVCTCLESTKTCVIRETSTASFGAPGILLLLLGLLLLLLVPLLLLFCLCGGVGAMGDFKAMPFEAKEQLISYHTEGQGEDKELALLQVPVEVDHGSIKAVNVNQYGGKGFVGGLVAGGAAGGGSAAGGGFNSSSFLTTDNINQFQGFHQDLGFVDMRHVTDGVMTGQERFSRFGAGAYDGMALSEGFLDDYYSSKADHAAQQSIERDALLIYDHEGEGSLAGSVGCCSLLENNDDLDFLNDLGPKFKTLANICRGSTLETESAEVHVSVCPPRPVSPARPSTSTHTHTHTHTETLRDRDRVSTHNASNVTSGSSTIMEERLVRERAPGSANVPKVHIQDSVLVPGPTFLIQQPTLYYAATPVYVVEPQPQVLLVAADAQQSMGQVALGQGIIHGSQGMVVVERQVGMGGGAGHVISGGGHVISGGGHVISGGGGHVISRGGGHVISGGGGHVISGGGHVLSGAGQTVKGGSFFKGGSGMVVGTAGNVATVPGFSQGSISRSREVIVVENESASSGVATSAGLAQFTQTGQGSSEQGLEIRGHSVQGADQSASLSSSSQFGSVGSNEVLNSALAATLLAHDGQSVVMQHNTISVTESNIETSIRA